MKQNKDIKGEELMKKLFKPSVNIEHLIEKLRQQENANYKLKKDIEYYEDLIERILEELNKFDTSDNEYLQQLKKIIPMLVKYWIKLKGLMNRNHLYYK